MRVLVVDDEPRYRVYLSAKLGSMGHEVAVAANGGQAIERGLRLLPSVLVSDWMLRNHVHGLHVAEALRAVHGGLAAILMTGFPSRDLRAQALGLGVSDFIEKPFELATMLAAVERAGAARRRPSVRVAFGVVVTCGELCVHVSNGARRMLRTTRAGRTPARLDEVFEREDLTALRDGADEWRSVVPRGAQRTRWWAHWTQRGEDGVLGVVPDNRRFLRDDPRLRLLLGLATPHGLPLASTKVLVLDATPLDEVRYPDALERAGFACIKAESPELARRLLVQMPEEAVVVIHRDAAPDLAALVRDLRELRPQARLIGASPRLSDEIAFAELGVGHFLQVPWRVGDLLDLLAPGPDDAGR